MAPITLEEVMQLVDQLTPEDQAALVDRVQKNIPKPHEAITRETLNAKLIQRRSAGAFEHVESLRNKYADPPLNLSDDALRASIREFANEWEKDIDDLLSDD